MKGFAVYSTELASFKIEYEADMLIGIKLVGDFADVGKKTELSDSVFLELCQYLKGEREHFAQRYEMRGTDFQKLVWAQLCKIPYGETRSYKQIAEAIGKPTAARAVGMANNKNPLLIIVPCHRVLGRDGSLVGYVGGVDMKRHLLDLENRK